MNYLQVHFRHRNRPICIPVTEETSRRVLNLVDTSHSLAAIEDIDTVYGQSVLIASDHVQFVQCLLEPAVPELPPEAINPSPFEALEDAESILDSDGLFDVTIWFAHQDSPLNVGWVTYSDWDSIRLSMSQPVRYFQFTDSDGEEVIIQTAEVDMILGTEIDRYSSEQLESIEKLTENWTAA